MILETNFSKSINLLNKDFCKRYKEAIISFVENEDLKLLAEKDGNKVLGTMFKINNLDYGFSVSIINGEYLVGLKINSLELNPEIENLMYMPAVKGVLAMTLNKVVSFDDKNDICDFGVELKTIYQLGKILEEKGYLKNNLNEKEYIEIALNRKNRYLPSDGREVVSILDDFKDLLKSGNYTEGGDRLNCGSDNYYVSNGKIYNDHDEGQTIIEIDINNNNLNVWDMSHSLKHKDLIQVQMNNNDAHIENNILIIENGKYKLMDDIGGFLMSLMLFNMDEMVEEINKRNNVSNSIKRKDF